MPKNIIPHISSEILISPIFSTLITLQEKRKKGRVSEASRSLAFANSTAHVSLIWLHV
jgi:hypothetical protein